jgi:hypothetical protein
MKILNIDEMLEAASESDMPHSGAFIDQFEALAQSLATELAKHLTIAIGSNATFEPGFGGLCVGFKSEHEGQSCPRCIDRHDEGGDWE